MLEAPDSWPAIVGLWFFVVVPFLALIAAIPLLWGYGMSVVDAVMLVVGYFVTGFGVTIGFHRHFTHGSFKASRWLRVVLAVTGVLAAEGHVSQWVADHRRHHAFADREGDPHSPWRYGTSVGALLRGLFHAQVGWLFCRDVTNRARFAPDLLADKDIQRVDRFFGPLIAVSLLGPGVIGGLVGGTWTAVLSGIFWGGIIRMALLHHVTWSVNSVCHVIGQRPFTCKDKATNFWPLAILSFGESWHNSHHADPTGARHGVLPGQLDPSARVIRWFERLGWVWDVRWPDRNRLGARMASSRNPSRAG
jgi:stearoyl-CoA desaturase (delta-9 desaturase)